MIESKLVLIAQQDQARWRNAIREQNLPAAMASDDHEQRMRERHERQGDVMTVRQGPPRQEPARRIVDKRRI